MVKNRNAIRNTLSTSFCLLTTVFVLAQAPAWWSARGVIDPNLPAHDYSPVTLGQLKWIATKAAEEMNAYFGAGPNVMAVVNAFVDSGNYIVATVGQVKYVAQPFYDRLYQLELIHTLPPGMPGHYPWPRYSSGGDYDLATIGQVKYVFSFDSAKDSDGDGFSDWQEEALRHGATIAGNVIYSGPQVGPIHVVLAVNADGSGIVQRQPLSQPGVFAFFEVPAWRTYYVKAWRDSNGNSYRDFWEAQGDSVANPIYLTANVANANVTLSDPDTDNDTLADWWEIMWFGSLAQGPNDDPDRDLISNQQEQHFSMDPTLTTVTIGNAALIQESGVPRPSDTSMFFPNPGCDQKDYVSQSTNFYGEKLPPDPKVENSIEDTEYASSFGYFARPQAGGECIDQDVGEFQQKYHEWLQIAVGGANTKSVFLEVDVLYPDFEWDREPCSELDINNPGLVARAAARGFDSAFLNRLKQYNIYPVFVLLNGPDNYAGTDNNTIAAHAEKFINFVYDHGVVAGYIVGTEIPRWTDKGFTTDKAYDVIKIIKDKVIGARYIPIGVHAQGKRDGKLVAGIPGNADFLAYEFSWNPWSGWLHGSGELSLENEDLLAFATQAALVMCNYGHTKVVHFLEYNCRVTGTAAKNQTAVLDYMFPYLWTDYGTCVGFSRSYWAEPIDWGGPIYPCP